MTSSLSSQCLMCSQVEHAVGRRGSNSKFLNAAASLDPLHNVLFCGVILCGSIAIETRCATRTEVKSSYFINSVLPDT